MSNKEKIRKKYFIRRKKKYFKVGKEFFAPFLNLLKMKFKFKKKKIAIYYPTNYELDILKIFDVEYLKKCDFLLPVIIDEKIIDFYKWRKNEVLNVNRYGILEPEKTKIYIPDIILVPLLAFDQKKNRLGYGNGFYDRYLNKSIKLQKNILTIGVAFSFQKYHNLPINDNDVKLDYIITEKGIIK